MAATADREGLWSGGREQWYPAAAAVRIFRHTLVGTDAAGYLLPLSDVPERRYVGVAGQAVFPGGGFGSGTGERRCPVLQHGELEFLYLGGSPAQSVVGQVAYCADDQTVTAERAATSHAYPVGRITALPRAGRVRVDITGYATTSLLLFLSGWRQKFSLHPQSFTLEAGKNWRLGVTLPDSFTERTWTAELVCGVAKVVVNRDTAWKSESYCGFNVYVPPDTPGVSYGMVELPFTLYCAGEGWPLGAGPFAGVWDVPAEIL